MPGISQQDAEDRAREFLDRWDIAPLKRDRAIIALTLEFLKVALEEARHARGVVPFVERVRSTVQTLMGRESL